VDRAYDWHFLAPNFGAYFRMMLVHLGLPQWQLLFTTAGPTPRAKVSLIGRLTSEANATNISGLLHPRKLGNFKN